MARPTGMTPVSSTFFVMGDFSTPTDPIKLLATVTMPHEFRSELPRLRQRQRMPRGKARGATECVPGPFHWLPPGGSGAARHSGQSAGAPPRHQREAASMWWSRNKKTGAPPEVCVAAAKEGGVPRSVRLFVTWPASLCFCLGPCLRVCLCHQRLRLISYSRKTFTKSKRTSAARQI